MQVTRITDAKPYETRGHFGMVGLRLQGEEASDAGLALLGLSHFLPAGGAESAASAIEKIYVVLSGAVTIAPDECDTTLGPLDSCWLAAGERRSIVYKGTLPASMLVILPTHRP